MTNKRRYRKRRTPKVDNYQPPFKQEVLAQGIEILTLREKTQTLLAGAGVNTILEVVKRQDRDFYRISTFNKKNLFDLKNALKKHGLYLKPTPKPADTEDGKGKGDTRTKSADGRRNNNKDKEKRQSAHPRQNTRRERRPAYVEVTKVVRPPKPTVEVIKDDPDIYVKVNKNGKWGFKNRSGKQMIEPIYDEVFSFKEELCCVQKDDYYGFINRDGQETIPFVYSCASSFSEGLACVYKGENCGYINTDNDVVVDFEFDAGTMVVNGECRVKKEGRWGELHIKLPADQDDDTEIAIGIDNIRWII